MTDTEKQCFDKLTKKRESFADQLDDPDYQGVKRTVVDKYSDQAHFIYELLQNADDAKATKSKIVLKADGIYFYHNGTIPFSISDPEIKETDKKKIGHINAITSIGNSNKEEKSNTIGKFGVGFKSVFQYTDTPHIYDTNFQFKIERFIVPKLLSNDIQRNKADTVFYLPFDKDGMEPLKAYREILEKLKLLVCPTLFLSHLKEVEWLAEKESGTYLMETKNKEEYTDIECNLIEILNEVNTKSENENLWLFKRTIADSEHKIAVGFFLDDEGKLKPVDYSAFCFFPTKESTKLKFIIHAPFLLTDSRESIKAGEDWNIKLVEELSILVADSFLVLKEKNLIDDNIINIIPYRISDFTEIGNKAKISFKPFYNSIKERLKTDSLLPTRKGQYTDKVHAYWAEYANIVGLYSDEQISELMNNKDAKIVFPTLHENNTTRGNKDLSDYIKDITNDIIRAVSILQKTTAVFFKKQYETNKKWLLEFYKYLYEAPNYYSYIRQKSIFINKNNNVVPAFDSRNQPILFMPTSEESEYNIIHKDFLKDETSKLFFEAFGIAKPNLKDEIYNIIIPKYSKNNALDTAAYFKKFFSYYKDCPSSQLADYLALLRNINCLQYKLANKGFTFLGNAESIYWPSPEIKTYFELNAQTRFLDIDFYQNLVKASEQKTLEEFILKLGVSKYPRVAESYVSASQIDFKYDARYLYDKYIDGCENLLNSINKDRSIALWRILLFMIKEAGNANFLMGQHKAGSWESFESSTLKKLKAKLWLVNKNNKFVLPNEITIEELSDEYDKAGNCAEILIGILDFKSPVMDSLNEKEQKWMDIGKKFDGCSDEDIQKALAHIKQKETAKPAFPQKNTPNPERRQDAMAEKYKNAEDKLYEKRERLVRVASVSSGEKKTYLENHYTNDEGIMVCQICEKEMPFKKRDGTYYYEAMEIFPNKRSSKHLSKNLPEQYIALCPECSARYNEYVVHDDSVMNELENHIINGTEMNLNLGDISESNYEPFTKNIRFVEPHLIDLQIILKEDRNG